MLSFIIVLLRERIRLLWRQLSYTRPCWRVWPSGSRGNILNVSILSVPTTCSFAQRSCTWMTVSGWRNATFTASCLTINTRTQPQHARDNTAFHQNCHGDLQGGGWGPTFKWLLFLVSVRGGGEVTVAHLVRQSLSQGGEHRWIQTFHCTVTLFSRGRQTKG